ncbi:MAG: helix-turn-helix transcriptional regulator [Chloroflexi bacterium]|nr:helix-turn-helix transcriptional regulator [Chloroflexota bacterium]
MPCFTKSSAIRRERAYPIFMMGKRGRPPHPGLLTPREQEVLALLREKLSNEKTAERLGITEGGVKYHVSEILSKLSLENRSDAARWRPDQARPWWSAAAVPLLFARKINLSMLPPVIAGGLAVAVAAGIGLLVWALLATQGNGGFDELVGLTPEEAITRYEAALVREGEVFHTTMETTITDAEGATEPFFEMEVWLDGGSEMSRSEFRLDPSQDLDITEELTTILIGETGYYRDCCDTRTADAQRCGGMPTTIDEITLFPLLFDCGDLSEQLQFGVLQVDIDVEYAGTPAVVLTREVMAQYPTETGPQFLDRVTVAFYLDRASFLPLAFVLISDSVEDEDDGTLLTTFQNEFLPPVSLPDDFFDPASIGYVAPDPFAGLNTTDPGISVYWLGEALPPQSGLPRLNFEDSDAFAAGVEPGWRLLIYYDKCVRLVLWPRDAWADIVQTDFGRIWWDSPCVQQEEIQLADRRIVIFSGYEPEDRGASAPTPTLPCPDRPFDLFIAHVYFQGTVVSINAPFCFFCVGRGAAIDPYDSREGMEAIARGLHLRPRDE